jgi:MipA family protein
MQPLISFMCLCLLMCASCANAQSSCDPAESACAEVGSWHLSLAVGAGVRTNPLAEGDDIPLILIPQLSYTGDRFFIQNLDMGFILLETEQHQLNLFITPSYDQVFFQRWSPSNFFIDSNNFATAGDKSVTKEEIPTINLDPKNELGPNNSFIPQSNNRYKRNLDKRRTAGLGGLEYNFTNALVDVQVQYLSDFTNIHHGDEARISIAKHWQLQKQRISTTLGAVWQSREVLNYYYGVAPHEADAAGTYYSANGVAKIARVEWSYRLTEQWDISFIASYRQLPDAIAKSPLINDDKVITGFMGAVYHF